MRKKRILFLIVLAFLFLPTLFQVEAYAIELSQKPAIEAITGILMERSTGRVIYNKDADARMYPASMTKILTAMLVLDNFSPDEIISMGREVNEVPIDSSKAGHKPGELISVENLIRALIIPSGNESGNVSAAATYTKQKGSAPPSYKEAERYFAQLMNEKAKSLGAVNSNFVNPHGYHDPEHYSTARDIAILSSASLNYPLLKQIIAEERFEGYGLGKEPEKDQLSQLYNWKSHNLLITSGDYYYPYAKGIKTGYTTPAGSCVASYAIKDGVELIGVIMKASDRGRWTDSISLLSYGYNNFSFKTVVQDTELIGEVSLSNQMLGQKELLPVYPMESYLGFYNDAELPFIEKRIEISPDLLETNSKLISQGEQKLLAPVSKGDAVGTVTLLFEGQEVFKTSLIASEDIGARSFKSDMAYYFKIALSFIFSVDALPYWIGFVALVLIIAIIVSLLSKRQRKSGFRFK